MKKFGGKVDEDKPQIKEFARHVVFKAPKTDKSKIVLTNPQLIMIFAKTSVGCGLGV